MALTTLLTKQLIEVTWSYRDLASYIIHIAGSFDYNNEKPLSYFSTYLDSQLQHARLVISFFHVSHLESANIYTKTPFV